MAFSASTITLLQTNVITSFSGYATERRKGMTIFREVAIPGAADDLSLSDTGDYPASATITPPVPFHGWLTFSETLEAKTAGPAH